MIKTLVLTTCAEKGLKNQAKTKVLDEKIRLKTVSYGHNILNRGRVYSILINSNLVSIKVNIWLKFNSIILPFVLCKRNDSYIQRRWQADPFKWHCLSMNSKFKTLEKMS